MAPGLPIPINKLMDYNLSQMTSPVSPPYCELEPWKDPFLYL
jgi:hypothetical protein